MTFQRYLPTVFQHSIPTPSNAMATGFQRVRSNSLVLRTIRALALGSDAPGCGGADLVPMARLQRGAGTGEGTVPLSLRKIRGVAHG